MKAWKMNEDNQELPIENGYPSLRGIRRKLRSNEVKRLFTLGSELFAAASPLLEKPSWWAVGRAAFAMGKVLSDDSTIWANEHFNNSNWTDLYGREFTQVILSVLQKFPYERLKTNEPSIMIRICTLPNGIKCGWTSCGRRADVAIIYVESARHEEARQFIKQQLWAQFADKSLLMRRNESTHPHSDDHVVFEVDDDFRSRLSKRAIDYAEYLKKPLAAGVPRSVMFYGPPGTGKSTLARTIIEKMGMRSFRIRVADLQGLNSATLQEALSIFNPDAIILDDFDRAHGQTELLETLELFQQSTKLVITTVNNRKRLDSALMRPGRIDELVLIDTMDEEVVKHVLGDYVDGFDIVKDWPIAFINEYVQRRKFMEPEEAAKSVTELSNRVAELLEYETDELLDVNRMLSVIEKTKAQDVEEVEEPPDTVPVPVVPED